MAENSGLRISFARKSTNKKGDKIAARGEAEETGRGRGERGEHMPKIPEGEAAEPHRKMYPYIYGLEIAGDKLPNASVRCEVLESDGVLAN